jgi:hypothetical protein
MTTVFDVFQVSEYTYLTVNRGGVYGNTIAESDVATGVFKLRNGMVMINNQESRQSDATLHVRPSESFATTDMVGNGIRKDGLDYEIIAQTGGQNYHDGVLEHYRLTLQRTDYADFTEVS